MITFVIKHCKARNLNITEDEALAAVDYSSKFIVVRVQNRFYWRTFATVKSLLYIGKVDAWLDKNLRR